MNKVQKLESYIRQNPDMDVFEKIEKDNDSILFRSKYTFNNSEKMFLIALDDSLFTQVLCRIATLDNPAKKEKMLYLINELNMKYKALKYTLNDSGDIDFSINYLALDEDFNPETLLMLTLTTFRDVEEDYAKFMRVIWA